jgi:hypothetical protein
MKSERYVAVAWLSAIAIGMLFWFVTIFLLFHAIGCSDPTMQGIAIGVGASAGAEESQKLAAASKEALIAEVLRLRQEVESAATAEEKAVLERQLAAAEDKQKVAELTESVADKVSEGLHKDWTSKDPGTQVENWQWIAGLAATLLYGAKKTVDARKLKGDVANGKRVSVGLVRSVNDLLSSPLVTDKDKAKVVLKESQEKVGVRESVRDLL